MGRLLIRADADGRMGTGHVMRCLALARAWQSADGPRHGSQSTFLSRCPIEGLRRRIRSAGNELILLDRSHPAPSDLAATLDVLAQAKTGSQPADATWVVLDGYHFDSSYQLAVRDAGGRVVAIDDSVRLPHYHADVLLNQNAGAEQLDCACDSETSLLLGPRFALLRPEFQPWESFRRMTPGLARKVLVTLGGADPTNATLPVLGALARLSDAAAKDAVPHWEAKIVLGPANPHLDSLREKLRRTSGNVQLLTDVDDMAELMAWADVAVTAAGTTCWELARMQLPAVALVVADNQEPIARRLAEMGAVTRPEHSGQDIEERIAEALSALCHDPDRRAKQSEVGRRLVDGRGAGRVVAVMRALAGPLPVEQTQLRRAVAEDVMPLWRLKNDPTVRQTAIASSARVPLHVHIEWFRQKLSSPDTRIWVLDFQGLVVGVVRYDRTGPATAEISMAVAAAFRRRGLATRMLRETRSPACRELQVTNLHAMIRQQNIPSARVFAKAGFVETIAKSINNQPCRLFKQTI